MESLSYRHFIVGTTGKMLPFGEYILVLEPQLHKDDKDTAGFIQTPLYGKMIHI